MEGKTIVPFNTKFLVSTQIRYELDSASEIWHCLYATGYDINQIEVHFIRKRDKSIGGLIAITFEGNPIDALKKIRQYLYKHPWILYYTHRIVPIEYVTLDPTLLINQAVKLALKKIDPNASWRITISRHATKIKRQPLIDSIASKINIGRVSLEKPDWIINIEIIKNTFLLSVLEPIDIIRRKDFTAIYEKKKLLDFVT